MTPQAIIEALATFCESVDLDDLEAAEAFATDQGADPYHIHARSVLSALADWRLSLWANRHA